MKSARIPDRFPTLRGRALTLRELIEDDLPAWLARLSDAEAAGLAGDPVTTSMQTVIDGLAHHRNAFRNKEAVRWSIVPEALGASVGSIGLAGFDAECTSAEIGAAIGRKHWGNGIATDAARLVIEYAFGALGLERVNAVVLPENSRVIRVLEKLGFERVSEEPSPAIGARTDVLLWRVSHSLDIKRDST